jgi:hypothetical protein
LHGGRVGNVELGVGETECAVAENIDEGAAEKTSRA